MTTPPAPSNFGGQPFGGPGRSGGASVGVAVLVGAVVAIGCALVWGVIAYSTQHEFSIMAILVGLAVGTVVARVGRVRSTGLAIASALLAVFGCALGSLVAEILILLRHGVPLSEILSGLNIVFRIYPSAVGGLGFVFWALAALYGYRIAMGMPMRWGLRRRPGSRLPGPPYGTQPYGTSPYGTPPHGNQPYGSQPYGSPGPNEQPPPGFSSPEQPPPGFSSPEQPPPGFSSPEQPPPGFSSPEQPPS
jgi:hypothetical protein